ncbi:MAG: class I SAM-dependent methyltransferase [candidate division KSB1 bacterium]|nr:class I SAM-dependent methyltransferase [candidate division KSB1 bacterium]
MKTVMFDKKIHTYAGHNPYIVPFVPPDSFVLDVGCGTGELGRRLQNGKHCRVYGIDISPQALVRAREHLYRTAVVDIEADTPQLPDQKFDVIILGDVIEHLRFPEPALKRLLQLLKTNGLVIVSIPNVANILIRLKLLAGKWQYTQSGIMDETHIRFYTFQSMLKLFENLGLQIKEFTSIPGRYFIKKSKRQNPTRLERLLSRWWPALFATQFVFKLEQR